MTIFSIIDWAVKIGSILILTLVFVHLLRGATISHQRWAVGALFFLQLGSLVAYYAAWWHRLANNPATKTLLWPQSDYLARHLTTDMTALTVGWIAAALLLVALWWVFLRRGQGRMLDGADVGQLFLAAAAVGWPSIFIMLAIVFALAIVLMLVLVIARKKVLQDRLVISPVIIPAAIITILFQAQLLSVSHLGKIGF